jgi:predicted metalloprotease with PDZ domain
MIPRRRDLLALAAAAPLLLRRARVQAAAGPGAPAVTLEVDAREASRRILRARLTFPAAPGPFALVYPKWLPGEHGPTGTINDVVGIALTVDGKSIAWQRDPEDLYLIRCQLPPGTRSLEAALDFVTAAGGRGAPSPAMASPRLAVIKWNHVVLYPQGADPRALTYVASLRLPADWSFAGALEIDRKTSDGARFRPVSLETLIDSPIAAGAYGRSLDLTPPGGPPHALALFADSPESLAIKDAALAGFRKLVVQTSRLFGAWPYHRYKFLLSLSDHIPHGGLEHHESSDNRSWERTLLDEAEWTARASLLPHEMVHAWNGKHRRPAGLVTRDYQQPMKTELLWVYEGLTTYLGDALAVRAGLRSPAEGREALAYSAALLAASPGRAWRPLVDTAVAAPALSGAAREWRSLRRGLDYYPEAQLVWLEADALIRETSAGRRSLDDLCQAFFGRTAHGAPAVVPYTLDDLIAALNDVHAHDWHAFFQARVYATTARAPLGGLEQAGWRLTYRDEPSGFFRAIEKASKEIDCTLSLGLVLKEDGTILDVVEGSPAARAGVAPAGKVIAANGRKHSREMLRAAVAATKSHPDVELLVEDDDFFRTHRLAWKGGDRFPALERDDRRPDLLAAIYGPRGGD